MAACFRYSFEFLRIGVRAHTYKTIVGRDRMDLGPKIPFKNCFLSQVQWQVTAPHRFFGKISFDTLWKEGRQANFDAF